jgi:GT2 family glycosyltransferase
VLYNSLKLEQEIRSDDSIRTDIALGQLDLCLGSAREITGILGAAELDEADHRFRGQVETVAPERISGWAIDHLAADRPVHLAIELDGIVIGTTRADRYQARFRSLSPHAQHGFDWPLPAECWNGRHRRLVVRIIGTAAPLAGTPADLHFPSQWLPPPPGQAAPPLSPPLRPAAQPAPGLVSAIVLNRNGAALLEALFASLARHIGTPLEVVLIDHASTDDSLAVAARWAERLDIRVEARAENHSFSASNNLGARLARGAQLLFLNNDIEFTQDPLPAMLRALVAPGVAAVGARLAEPVVKADGSLRPVLHHDGIEFRLLHGGAHGRSLWLPFEVEAEAADPSAGPSAAPAATAAMLLMRRADFLGAGGFDEGFDYGLEDVDLCLRLGRQLGQVMVARDAVAVHQRSATRNLRSAAALADPVQAGGERRELANRQHFLRRQAAWLKRRLRQAALDGDSIWRPARFRLGFVLGQPEQAALVEPLAAALAETVGWDAALLDAAEADWRGLDAVVALHPATDLRRTLNATPGLLVGAWVQGQVAAWLEAGQLPACDVIFAASPRIARALHDATGLAITLLPPATDPCRFTPLAAPLPPETDLLFPGPPHPAVPALLAGLPGLHASILGAGWDAAEPHWRGDLPHRDRPAAYAAARLVLDLATPEQADWAVLDHRVLDAAACGTLALTDNAAAAEAMLPGLVPSFTDAASLAERATALLADEHGRAAAAARLRAAVVAGHGWPQRAATLAAAMRQAAGRLRFGLKLPGPATAEAHALLLALRRQGHAARLDPPAAWCDGIGAGDDASLVLGDSPGGDTPGDDPDPRALALWWPPAGLDAALPASFDHAFRALAAPDPADAKAWDGVAAHILAITQRLLAGERIG